MIIDRPITIALTLFIILLLVFFLVVPEYNTFGRLQTDLGEKTAEFNAEFDYYAAIAKTYSELQAHQDDIKKIDDALPAASYPTLGGTIYFMQETAKENGLIIKNLFLSQSSSSNAGPGVSSSVKDLIFSIDLLGSYSSLENFISSLEKSSRIFEITNISFGSVPGSQYNFSLQIKTHSY